ncbi:MAG: DUF4159 domain-containing protein [Gemmatimonadetes bacterium]|nr:DUF4159 domain-containing protein [Gemmatimonadota bacterium]NIQ51911.1 DUF4159 domain-containing protein [Gemmatimonadota bacterium]NIU72018.1 DUF4159 domain-containing protein [Gammaproteobacteria bacterium]NIX42584.1 DUF4159 domain-containing protein [Gemmatimonadota bacterium]NIY06759.1 DUF4159 domain-containing protein [Gemmatimonadota bacterium]
MRSIPPMVVVALLSLAAAPEPTPMSAGAGATQAQPQGVRAPVPPHSFYFARAAYGGAGRWGRRAWHTDFPKADRQFLVVLRRVTNLDAYAGEHPIPLEDPELRRYPFLYAVEVGRMDLTDGEAEALRGYLLAGGFLVVDDFWGTREWAAFERNIRKVLPDRPIVDLPRDHPVFHTYYEIDEIVQVPAVNFRARGGRTWERDGRVPHVRGIFGEDGRLLVAINWNTDLGDAWEWADLPEYPLEYSTFAYEMGVNFIVYAMSH